LGTEPARAAAIEDSSNGLRAAAAAGLAVVAIPNSAYPPDPDSLALADVVIGSVGAVTGDIISALRIEETEHGR
jgi:beta-phosphoglucomutase-like phosphatase (HAD superfamily)